MTLDTTIQKLTCHLSIDDPSRLPARAEMPHHQAIANAIREEDLLRAPLKYLVLEDMGFWKR
ncbi:hypothetical protein A1O7_08719 [Cladophialophora yegresii CBS 114405]|uniref:Uncharacterized protein n=1 Tax=Cladophialophora yegresii CBS 114405 TaxID=1182544 RepID=W9WB61_9EURO|nr:uncharacterized protein A1O7_08719 [Cladophialophora yegresii CBS 114405]EXJ55789.1 hypothetical protein A1O7_08719 [Cladophialophora yegresii CBS 114405]